MSEDNRLENEKQDRCRKLVQREVLHNCSTLISELCGKEDYMEDLMEVCVKTAYQYVVSDPDGKEIGRFDDESEADELAEDKGEGFDVETEEENREALEHWIVSDWFGDKLEERGEMVVEFKDFRIWGRTTSGQAILIDGVIRDIEQELNS